MRAMQSMPTTPYRVGHKLMSGTKVIATIKAIEPFGVNYAVTFTNGNGIVVPPRYIADDAR